MYNLTSYTYISYLIFKFQLELYNAMVLHTSPPSAIVSCRLWSEVNPFCGDFIG